MNIKATADQITDNMRKLVHGDDMAREAHKEAVSFYSLTWPLTKAIRYDLVDHVTSDGEAHITAMLDATNQLVEAALRRLARRRVDPDFAVKRTIISLAANHRHQDRMHDFETFCTVLDATGILVNNYLKWYICYLTEMNKD